MSGPPTAPTAERRPHEADGSSASGLARQHQSTTRNRQTPRWHAVAECRVVVGRIRPRLLLLVADCPGCRQPHVHFARIPYTATIRTGACGMRYLVHVIGEEVAA
jgi:hypothetical protein